MRARVALSATLSLMFLAVAAQAAPVQWSTAIGGNDHWYEVVASESITWTDARSAAQGMGSGWDLASIGSADEHAFVTSLLSTAAPQRSHYWLGATDLAQEGVWQWMDATPWNFTVWGAGEPNNAGAAEHYLAYDLRGTTWVFNDAPDNVGQIFGFARGFIVERSAVSPVPEPSTAGLVALGLLAVRRGRRRH